MKTERSVKDCFINARHEAEAELYRIFPKEDPIVILDIGACDGLSSIRYANMWPRAKIIAFEMIRDNAEECEQNFLEYGIQDRAKVICVALTSYTGVIDAHRSYGQAPGITTWDTGNKSSSVLMPKGHKKVHPWCKFEPYRANCSRLDNYVHFPKFDFLHMDVQGAELKVLAGAGKRLSEVRAIWLEVVNKPLYQGQPVKNEVILYMRSAGLELEKDCCGDGASGDCLFVRGFR